VFGLQDTIGVSADGRVGTAFNIIEQECRFFIRGCLIHPLFEITSEKAAAFIRYMVVNGNGLVIFTTVGK